MFSMPTRGITEVSYSEKLRRTVGIRDDIRQVSVQGSCRSIGRVGLRGVLISSMPVISALGNSPGSLEAPADLTSCLNIRSYS